VVYEQDWLITTFLNMQATQNNVTNSRQWLVSMGKAASQLGLTIQYCMALPNHILQSVEIQSVTQARASDDYQPGNNQWQLGHASLFFWSVGLAPFKDTFWSSSTPQPGCNPTYSKCEEPNPVLETLVATLTAGPVGPSDSIGQLNPDLIMRTCAQSGILLKADKPATPPDSALLPLSGQQSPQLLQVWDTFSTFGRYSWHYIFAGDLESPFTINAKDIGISGRSSRVVDFFALANATAKLVAFDDTHPLRISLPSSKPPVVQFGYYIIAPVLDSGWVLLGETEKFITTSKQRFSSLNSFLSNFSVTLTGTKNEKVSIGVANTAVEGAPLIVLLRTFTGDSLTISCTAGVQGSCK